jgi:hypothetical protein
MNKQPLSKTFNCRHSLPLVGRDANLHAMGTLNSCWNSKCQTAIKSELFDVASGHPVASTSYEVPGVSAHCVRRTDSDSGICRRREITCRGNRTTHAHSVGDSQHSENLPVELFPTFETLNQVPPKGLPRKSTRPRDREDRRNN